MLNVKLSKNNKFIDSCVQTKFKGFVTSKVLFCPEGLPFMDFSPEMNGIPVCEITSLPLNFPNSTAIYGFIGKNDN